MPVDAVSFKQAMSRFASGVTVVTTVDESGQPRGMTASAFSSLSLDPPLVLVCIDHRASLCNLLPVGKAFGINILTDKQAEISTRFATNEPERFRDFHYEKGLNDTPLLPDVLAVIECLVTAVLPGGDHSIVVGQVERSHVSDEPPLLHFRGAYGRLGKL